MDKQTFYNELSDRLLKLGLSREYIERHLAQFDSYFDGKNDDEISKEIAKLGDLDKVAARIKRMTEKAIIEAQEENEAMNDQQHNEAVIINRTEDIDNDDIGAVSVSFDEENLSDDDMHVFESSVHNEQIIDSANEPSGLEPHGTKRGVTIKTDNQSSITSAPIDPSVIEKNRRKFWLIFAATLPITVALIAATAAAFGFVFFLIAVVMLIAIGALIAVTAAGTLVSVFGLIFGASQMLSNVPVGLYECGVAIMIGAVAIAVGILVYNFAVRLMPLAAKLLLSFAHYVARKYRELYVYLKKECIGL